MSKRLQSLYQTIRSAIFSSPEEHRWCRVDYHQMRFVTKLGWFTGDVDSSVLTGAETQVRLTWLVADKEAQKQEKLLRIRSRLLAPVYMQSHSDLNRVNVEYL